MIDVDIHKAAREGSLQAVTDYLAAGGSPNAVDPYDCEPLFYAVKHNHLGVARVLLRAGGDIRRESKFRGDPLGVAVWNLNQPMVDFVLAAGVDINRIIKGETPLDHLHKLRTFAPGPSGTVFPREGEAAEMHRNLVSRGAVFFYYKKSTS